MMMKKRNRPAGLVKEEHYGTTGQLVADQAPDTAHHIDISIYVEAVSGRVLAGAARAVHHRTMCHGVWQCPNEAG